MPIKRGGPKLKAHQFTGFDDLQKSLKTSGSSDYFYRMQEGKVLMRFMADPDRWWDAHLHYDPGAKRTVACTEEDCYMCEEGDKARKVWLAPVVLIDEGAVRVFQMPKTVVDDLGDFYEDNKTMTDRDYFIIRKGTSLNDTEYKVRETMPKKRNLSKYDDEFPDIGAMLESMRAVDPDTETPAKGRRDRDEEDDDEPDYRPRRNAAKRNPAATRTAPRPRRSQENEEKELPRDIRRPRRTTERAPDRASTKSARPIRRPR